MSRVIDSSGWHSGDGEEPILQGAWTADEVARLCDVQRRYRAGLLNEFTPEVRRWRFYRWAVRVKGLFRG